MRPLYVGARSLLIAWSSWSPVDLRGPSRSVQQQSIPRYGCYNRALDHPRSCQDLSCRLYRWDEIALEKITEMVSRKFVSGERETMAQIYLKRGAIVPQHAHESEQMTYVLQGALKLLVAGEEVTLREGEVLHIPSNVPHQVEALDDTFVLGVFSPVRADWDFPANHDWEVRVALWVRRSLPSLSSWGIALSDHEP